MKRITKKIVIFYIVLIVIICVVSEIFIYIFLTYKDFYHYSGELEKNVIGSYPNNILPNSRYVWQYMPNTSFKLSNPKDNASVEVQINSQGFRDEEPNKRASNSYKIIALGDSFTFGWLVEHKDRWDEKLVSFINNNTNIQADSINLGMWMSTFDQHALILEDNYSNANIIIHLVYPSHIHTINSHSDEIINGKITKVLGHTLTINKNRLLHCINNVFCEKRIWFPYTFCAVNYVLTKNKFMRLLESEMGKISTLKGELIYQKSGQNYFKKGYELLEMSISQIAEFAKKKNIPYLVVVIPSKIQIPSVSHKKLTSKQKIIQTTAIPQKRIKEICNKTDWVMYLDMLEIFRKNENENYYFKNDPHWNSEGHRLAAEQIFNYIIKEKIITSFKRYLNSDKQTSQSL